MDGDKKAANEAGKEQEYKGLREVQDRLDALNERYMSKSLADALKIIGDALLYYYPRKKCDRN